MLTATTMIYFASPDDDAPPCTWEEFVAVNKDGMDAEELAEIKAALENCGVYRGGGGAAAEYELRLFTQSRSRSAVTRVTFSHNLIRVYPQ